MNKYLYRVEDSPVYSQGDMPYTIHIFRVISETNKTFLLKNDKLTYKGKRMFKDSKNRYAFEDKEDALNHYLYRKEYQLSCLRCKIDKIENIIKHLKKKNYATNNISTFKS